MAPILKEKKKSDSKITFFFKRHSKITLIESEVMKYHMMFNKNITLYTLSFYKDFYFILFFLQKKICPP